MGGRSPERLGDKLGPRLAQLWLSTTMAARGALAPHEARVAAAATQQLVDRAGREVADLYAPIMAEALRLDGMHPHVRHVVEHTASGVHQWQALAGFAVGSSGISSVLSEIVSNELAPVSYGIIGTNPHLIPDFGTIAGLAAKGRIPVAEAIHSGRQLGYHDGWTTWLIEAAQSIPDITTLAALVNRGLINPSEAGLWLERAGIPASLHAHLVDLRRTLVSPADAALAVVRSVLTTAEGARIAAESGVTGADFRLLESITGEPLGLQQLQEALRRGFIDRARFEKGVLESRVRNEWIPTALDLQYVPVPTADAIDAQLRGHLPVAEARKIAEQNGIEPAQVQILLDNAGSPPGDMQVLELWRRGYITEAAADEMLRFGRLRDQFIPAVKHLRFEPMTTADAADALLRGHIGQAEAELIMRENGLLPRDIPAVIANAGNPLGLVQLLEALRRGFIDEAQFTKGFKESRYRNEWEATALRLRYAPMSTADAVQASIQNHITQAQAKRIATENGLDPADFLALWETAGEPLSRTELEQLYNRGQIPLAVVEQGLRESRLKDKYVKDAVQLHVRLPQPREVVTALTDGVVTRAAATDMLADQGFDQATVAMLIATGEVKSTGPHRQLLTAEISALYSDRIISDETATDMLTHLHYTGESASLILRLADYTRQRKIIDSGIAAVKSHFLAHRIDATTAAADLHAMGLPVSASDTYLRVWKLDRLAHPRQLTEAQIVKAGKLELFVTDATLTAEQRAQANHDAALGRLVALGYDSTDAALLLAGA